VEDVEAALLATQRVVAETDIEEDRVLRLGQIGDGEQVVRLEGGNDDEGAVFQDLFGLGGNVAVDRDDVLDEVVFLAEELTLQGTIEARDFAQKLACGSFRCRVDGGLKVAHPALQALPILPAQRRCAKRHKSDADCRVFPRA
jgi:hypothetical protein